MAIKLGKILGKVGSFLSGGLTDVVGNLFSAKQQQGFNAAEAQKQRSFEERMSSTSWQRGVADMKAAGINPMLSFMEGGASTPSGGTASGDKADLGGVVSSALSSKRLGAELAVLESQKQANSARVIKDTTDALALQQDMESPEKTAGDPGGRSYRQMAAMTRMALMRAQIGLLNSSKALNTADLPGRKITGSKVGGIARLINPFARWF